MRILNISLADDLYGKSPEPVTIYIANPLPQNRHREDHQAEARALADALDQALPQATRHELLCELLARTAVLYRGI